MLNAKNVNSMPIVSLLFFQNFHLFFINSLLAKYTNPNIEIFSFDMNTGCLGFFDPRIAFFAFVPFGLFASVLGNAGYTISLMYFVPQVVTNSMLAEPFVAQLLGYVLNIDFFPGALTIFGTIFTAIGVYLINKANMVEAEEAEKEEEEIFENKPKKLRIN